LALPGRRSENRSHRSPAKRPLIRLAKTITKNEYGYLRAKLI
jgi:hypothetical protein